MRKKPLIISLLATISALSLWMVYSRQKRSRQKEKTETLNSKIVIIGGGTSGITVAAKLCNEITNPDITIIEPSDKHFYQPAFTLVAGGELDPEKTIREEKPLIPKNVKWLKDSVIEISPEKNLVFTTNQVVKYDYLVIAPGLQLNFDKIKGLDDNLGKNGICSVYTIESAKKTWQMIQNFNGGGVIFTFPNTPVKGLEAGLEIMYMMDSYLQKQNIKNRTEIIYASAAPKLFEVDGFRETLEKITESKGITHKFSHNLVEIRPDKKEAVFSYMKKREVDGSIEFKESQEIIPYDFIHIVPPMSAPDFIRKNRLSIQEGPGLGWLNVNKFTLQHHEFKNIFGIGDVIETSSNKTGAAISRQAPVLVHNLLELMKGNDEDNFIKYDGYTAFPIETDNRKVILAEFDYNKKPKPSFPFDMTKERYSMWLLKVYALPYLYWNRMLKGKV